MAVWVGIDVAKEVHWVTALADTGEVLVDRRVPNEPAALGALAAELAALGDDVAVGVDVLGGIASLLSAVLAEAGLRLVHVPGLAVNRATAPAPSTITASKTTRPSSRARSSRPGSSSIVAFTS